MTPDVSSSAAGSLADQFMQHLSGAPLAQIAGQLGLDTQQAHSAAAMAVPLLLGAMANNAQQPQGAQALLGALQRDHARPAAAAGPDWGGLLDSVLGGASGEGGQGAAILGHIFGGHRSQAEAGLGRATGLGDNAGQLLRLLAPLVMAFLAQRVGSGGLGADGLGGLLGRERAQAQQGGSPASDLLSRVLDQDGNGRVDLGDLLKLGGSLLGGRR
ncbi:calcium-binding protein [Melaminivora suipulveris]|uniref:Calcium-binding protein n=1 Tax=Melaminivora suipulveris TaxID=2109913 RepID=A0A2R3Q8U1_9BURK|nr:DUF937 domain-containing protein [Melaminivora suipulveris]AVO48205.1 calcium-binding protein [Melaminivora suipulveris]